MLSVQVASGRRIVTALEPGEEVLASVAALCQQYQFRTAGVPAFLGAFARVTLIGTREPTVHLHAAAAVPEKANQP